MTGPVKNITWAKYPIGDVTQWFGENKELYSQMNMIGHNGIDIVRPHGEHLFAVEDGEVCDLKLDPGGYGKHFRIKSTDGLREWTYGHCADIYVYKGQKVKEGQFIATMGNTGFVVSGNTPYWGSNPYAGTHVHFGLRPYKNGKIQSYSNGYFGSIDPLPSFLDPKLLSTKVIHISGVVNDKVVLQLGYLLKSIGL